MMLFSPFFLTSNDHALYFQWMELACATLFESDKDGVVDWLLLSVVYKVSLCSHNSSGSLSCWIQVQAVPNQQLFFSLLRITCLVQGQQPI